MKTLMIAGGLALSLAAAPPAAAQTPSAAEVADMQCFAVVALLGSQMEEDSPDMAGIAGGMMYYLGRLEGRSPRTDWLKQMKTYLEKIDEKELEPHFERCGRELEITGSAMVAWGDPADGE